MLPWHAAMIRDYQRSKVYDWEREFPEGPSMSFDDIVAYVEQVWSACGLIYPPAVKALHTNNRRAAGKGKRDAVLFPSEGATQKTVLHELAHSMTCTVDGRSHRHGPYFVGVYMRLLNQFMDIPYPALIYQAKMHGIDYEVTASPSFLDSKGDHYGSEY